MIQINTPLENLWFYILHCKYQAQIPSTHNSIYMQCIFDTVSPLYNFCTDGAKRDTDMPFWSRFLYIQIKSESGCILWYSKFLLCRGAMCGIQGTCPRLQAVTQVGNQKRWLLWEKIELYSPVGNVISQAVSGQFIWPFFTVIKVQVWKHVESPLPHNPVSISHNKIPVCWLRFL